VVNVSAQRSERTTGPVGPGRTTSCIGAGGTDVTTGSNEPVTASLDAAALCRSCGACCSFSRDWPRFTTEDECDLERIPRAFADHHLGRMQCDGDRCAALVGEVGNATSCAIYDVRPEVCRACEPGDDACRMARDRFALP